MKTLFLSRLVIPLEQVWSHKIRSSYDWHKWIWHGFSGEGVSTRDFLYRVDFYERTVRVLVLSNAQPNNIGEWRFETKNVAESFLAQSAYRFQIKVNPTYRRKADGRRLALYQEDEIYDWFRRKMSALGCELVSVECHQKHDEIFVKDGKRGKHFSADLNGIMKVVDTALFQEGYSKGIGSAKGFGFGLLMLQPISI